MHVGMQCVTHNDLGEVAVYYKPVYLPFLLRRSGLLQVLRKQLAAAEEALLQAGLSVDHGLVKVKTPRPMPNLAALLDKENKCP